MLRLDMKYRSSVESVCRSFEVSEQEYAQKFWEMSETRGWELWKITVLRMRRDLQESLQSATDSAEIYRLQGALELLRVLYEESLETACDIAEKRRREAEEVPEERRVGPESYLDANGNRRYVDI